MVAGPVGAGAARLQGLGAHALLGSPGPVGGPYPVGAILQPLRSEPALMSYGVSLEEAERIEDLRQVIILRIAPVITGKRTGDIVHGLLAAAATLVQRASTFDADAFAADARETFLAYEGAEREP